MDELRPEILVAIISGISLVIGTVIGGLISFFTNVHSNKREDKRFEQRLTHERLQQQSEERKFEQQLEHENRQQLRKYKIKRLNEVLIPIIEIYEKENNLLNDLEESGNVIVIGKGTQHHQAKEIESIIERNKLYMSVDLLKEYGDAIADYEFTMKHDHASSQIFELEQRGEEVASFLFDESKEFLKKVEQEAKIIESEYT